MTPGRVYRSEFPEGILLGEVFLPLPVSQAVAPRVRVAWVEKLRKVLNQENGFILESRVQESQTFLSSSDTSL